MAKKKTKRKVTKKKKSKKTFKLKKDIRYAALSKSKAIKVRKELIDYDPEWLKHLEKNDPKAFNYYAQFIDEYVHNNVKKTKDKRKVREGHLHNTLELAKSVGDNNNRRNNDVFGVTKVNNLVSQLTEDIDREGVYISNSKLYEDAMISELDKSRETTTEEMLLSLEEYKELRSNMTKEVVNFYDNYYGLAKKSSNNT